MSITALFVAFPEMFKNKVKTKPKLPEPEVDNSEMLNIGGWTAYSDEDQRTDNKPKPDQQCEVMTANGQRLATYAPKRNLYLHWVADDCTHPLQNCNLNGYVTAWRLPV